MPPFLCNKGIIASSERNNKTCLIVSESRHDINEVNKRFREIVSERT